MRGWHGGSSGSFLESIGVENMKEMDDYTKISLKALGVDLIAWPVAFILTFLIVTYANDPVY